MIASLIQASRNASVAAIAAAFPVASMKVDGNMTFVLLSEGVVELAGN